MVYGYDACTINEQGLKRMQEVSIAAGPESLRKLAEFLSETADELESISHSAHWHKHAPAELRRALGCDIILFDSDL